MSVSHSLRRWIPLLLLVLAIAAAGHVAWAQAPQPGGGPGVLTETPTEAPPTAKTPMFKKSLFAILKDGGVLMIPLFACSFITLVFVLERAISLRRGRVIPGPFVKRFLHQLQLL